MPNYTRAAVLWGPGKPWEIVDVEIDDPKANEVLVRIEASGLCHSDDHVRTGDTTVRYPVVGGHEGAGVVEKIGPGVTRAKVGDRVITGYIPTCGLCKPCLAGKHNLCDTGLHAATGLMQDGTHRLHIGDTDLGGFCASGTFSERVVISENALIPLPDDISFEVGALLGCGVPTGWGSAVKTAGVKPGDTVVIYGAGGIGLSAVQGAAIAGALRVVVVDPVQLKRDAALELGATHVFAAHAEALDFVREATWGRLAEHSIIAVGINNSTVFGEAVAIVGKAGQITVTAVGKTPEDQVVTGGNLLIGYEKRIQGAMFGSLSPLLDIPRLIDLYRAGALKIDELITKRYTLDQVNEGYQDLIDGKNLRGVIIHN